MIYFNTKDIQISKIKEDSKLRLAVTSEDFRVYGLKQENNPPILIEYCRRHDQRNKLYEKTQKLCGFFVRSGINCVARELVEKVDKMGECPIDFKIYIGLRRDLRENILLSSAIIKTIIFFMDGRIKLSEQNLIKDIPKFI